MLIIVIKWIRWFWGVHNVTSFRDDDGFSRVPSPNSSQLSINVACKNCELLILMFSAIMFHNAKLVCFYKTAIWKCSVAKTNLFITMQTLCVVCSLTFGQAQIIPCSRSPSQQEIFARNLNCGFLETSWVEYSVNTIHIQGTHQGPMPTASCWPVLACCYGKTN